MERARGIEPSNRRQVGLRAYLPAPAEGARSGRLTISPASANMTLVIPRVADPLACPHEGDTSPSKPLDWRFNCMELARGIEPPTCGLQNRCSAIELRQPECIGLQTHPDMLERKPNNCV